MKNCSDLYVLSAIACQLSEYLTEEELEFLSASLQALGEMLDVVAARQNLCKK